MKLAQSHYFFLFLLSCLFMGCEEANINKIHELADFDTSENTGSGKLNAVFLKGKESRVILYDGPWLERIDKIDVLNSDFSWVFFYKKNEAPRDVFENAVSQKKELLNLIMKEGIEEISFGMYIFIEDAEVFEGVAPFACYDKKTMKKELFFVENEFFEGVPFATKIKLPDSFRLKYPIGSRQLQYWPFFIKSNSVVPGEQEYAAFEFSSCITGVYHGLKETEFTSLAPTVISWRYKSNEKIAIKKLYAKIITFDLKNNTRTVYDTIQSWRSPTCATNHSKENAGVPK